MSWDTYFRLPTGTTGALFWTLALPALALIAAVVSEMWRKRRARLRGLAAEWDTVGRIAEDKELTEDEVGLLHSTIERWAPDDPLHAVTVRQQFDKCVAAEMGSLLDAGDGEAYIEHGLLLRDIRVKLALDYVPVSQRIYSSRELYTGTTIFVAKESESPIRWHRVRVMEIDEGFFYVANQEPGENKLFLVPGESVRCRVWREDDARYSFNVVYDHFEENPPLMVFRHADELKRVQARVHFRVHMEQAVTVGVLNAPVDGGGEDLSKRTIVTRIRGVLINLSAGGFAINAQQTISPHVILRIPLELDASGPIQVEARVIASTPLFGGRYLVRGSFVGISDEKRDKIARYVLYRQKNLLPGVKKAE